MHFFSIDEIPDLDKQFDMLNTKETFDVMERVRDLGYNLVAEESSPYSNIGNTVGIYPRHTQLMYEQKKRKNNSIRV